MKDNNVNDYNSNNINNYFFSDDNFFVNNLFFYENVDNDVNCEFNNKIDSKSNDSKCNDGFDLELNGRKFIKNNMKPNEDSNNNKTKVNRVKNNKSKFKPDKYFCDEINPYFLETKNYIQPLCVFYNNIGIYKKAFFHRIKYCDKKTNLASKEDIERWNCKRIKCDSESGFVLESDDKFTLADIHNWSSSVRCDVIDINVVVVNIQRLNNKQEINAMKKKYLSQTLTKLNPDIIFLMDIGVNEDLNVNGFKKYESVDGNNKNALFVSHNIVENVEVVDNCFIFKNLRMLFSYLIPNFVNYKQADMIINYNKLGFSIIGDLNLKSNVKFKQFLVIKAIIGEDSMQTVIINENNLMKFDAEIAPSDHDLIVFTVKKMCHNTLKIRLSSLGAEANIKFVKEILLGNDPPVKTIIKTEKKRIDFDNNMEAINELVTKLVVNEDSRPAYNYYGKIWRNRRREPFLGTKAPVSVVEDFMLKYEHNENKQYPSRPNLPFEINSSKIKGSKSKALNYELINLMNISDCVKAMFDAEDNRQEALECFSAKEKKDMETLAKEMSGQKITFNEGLNNVINYVDRHKADMMAKTFFLIKNKALKNAGDVRTITIVPTAFKIYESIIYDKVFDYLSYLINKDCKYQFGGTDGGSCFEAFYCLMRRCKDSKGIIMVDFVRGYDNVLWDKLESFINALEDENIKNILLYWLWMVKITDSEMNGIRVRRGKGIPMGLSLSPLIFDFYVHSILTSHNLSLKDKVMYIDDLAICIDKNLDKNSIVSKWYDFINIFQQYGLMVNKKKTCILTEFVEVAEAASTMGIAADSIEKYLGIKLSIDSGDIKFDESNFKDNNLCSRNLFYSSLLLQRLMLVGGLDAKLRYCCMMLPLQSEILRYKLWKKNMNFFKKEFWKLSYLQLSLISWNMFRYCLNPCDVRRIVSLVDKENMGQMVNLVKSWLKCGIEQVDNIIDKMAFNFADIIRDRDLTLEALKKDKDNKNNIMEKKDSDEEEEVEENSPKKMAYTMDENGDLELEFSETTEIINMWWSNFKITGLLEWMKLKKAQGQEIYINLPDIIDCKFFVNVRWIQDLIMQHYPRFDSLLEVTNDFNWLREKINLWRLLNLLVLNIKDLIEVDNVFLLEREDEFNKIKMNDDALLMPNENMEYYIKRKWWYAWFKALRKNLESIVPKLKKLETEEKGAKWRLIYPMLLYMDIIYVDKKFREYDLATLITIFNFKIKFATYTMKSLIDLEKQVERASGNKTVNIKQWSMSLDKSIERYISVDGSFNSSNEQIGAGIYVKDGDKELKFYGRWCEESFRSGRNIVGELVAASIAIDMAVQWGWKEVILVTDYMGTAALIEHQWSPNSPLSAWFSRIISSFFFKIKIMVYKVKSHTNTRSNEIADALAKKGALNEKANKKWLNDAVEIDLSEWFSHHV